MPTRISNVVGDQPRLPNVRCRCVAVLAALSAACTAPPEPPAATRLTSSDTALVAIWNWAKTTSDRYVGKDSDPVGPWYEAALPKREAFCIRDVSHQSIAAEILGHSRQNLNMFRHFVDNISETKDWCSYWEINRYNRPAPVDYASDDDFWYNLNANFDIIDASSKLYQWTGNRAYIDDPQFDRFFRLTLHEYVDRWQLQPDRIMDRTPFMNLRANTIRYREARGIPSYDEAQKQLVAGSDLVGMILNGYATYARILTARGDSAAAAPYVARAAEYKTLLDTRWWDAKAQRYHGFYHGDGHFSPSGTNGSAFLLWYHAIDEPARIERALDAMESSQVEVLSYLPMLFYRYGRDSAAYEYLGKIYRDTRRMYPEASSGAVEGIVRGMLGIEPSAIDGRIVTVPRLTSQTAWVAAEQIPVLNGRITVRHDGTTKTTFTNHSVRAVTWRATFPGDAARLVIDGTEMIATRHRNAVGREFAYVDVVVAPGEKRVVERR
jgi:hypothetical protein